MFRQFPFSSQPVTVTPLEKLKKHHEKDTVYLDRQRAHQNPDYSKAKDQDLYTARNIAKKLKAQGSRLSFSLKSDFIVILQPVRITLFDKVCKRYENTKKNISRQNLEQKQHNNGSENDNSSTPRNSATVSGSLNQYIMFRQFSFSSLLCSQ